MNKRPTLTPDSKSKAKTPWPRTPDIHPTKFCRALGPGFSPPSAPIVRQFLTDGDCKQMQAFIDKAADCARIMGENDYITARSEVVRLQGNRVDIPRAEALRRKADAMDVEAYHKAEVDFHASEAAAREFSARLTERLAPKLRAIHEREAVAAEERLAQYSMPLSWIDPNDSAPVDAWHLHDDRTLCLLHHEAWCAENFWPGEFVEPRWHNVSPREWFQTLLSHD